MLENELHFVFCILCHFSTFSAQTIDVRSKVSIRRIRVLILDFIHVLFLVNNPYLSSLLSMYFWLILFLNFILVIIQELWLSIPFYYICRLPYIFLLWCTQGKQKPPSTLPHTQRDASPVSTPLQSANAHKEP